MLCSLSPTFLPSINALLAALALPFSIDHPTDLTPSLLLAIFESLIGARLPIPTAVRQSRTRDAKARAMLVLLGVLECDVLRGGASSDSIVASTADDSVLGGAGGVSVDGWVDEIGLGEVDPERLADGGWEETIFVGELLCWLARRRRMLPRTKSSHRTSQPCSLYSDYHSYGTEADTADLSMSLLMQPSPPQKSPRQSPSSFADIGADAESSILSHITDIPRHPLVHSPEPSLSVSATTGTDLSIRARTLSSRTSLSNTHDNSDDFEEASQDTLQLYDSRRLMQDAEEDGDRLPTFRPQCIHELDDPSYIRVLAGPSGDEDLSGDDADDVKAHVPSTPTPRRVRLTGWIEAVDSVAESSHFAAFRPHSYSRTFNESSVSGSGPPSRSQTLSYQHERTGDLLKSTSRLKSSLSPPLPPVRLSPSPPLPTSSRHPPMRSSQSPPSSPAHSDPPFDVSFSTLNNTSTPAKPRLPQRTQLYPRGSDTHARADKSKTSMAVTNGSGTGRPRRRDRSPSYAPSPPSFMMPGGVQNSGTGPGLMPGTRSNQPVTTTGRKTTPRSTSPLPTSAGASTGIRINSLPPGSTVTTNTLLTERARLLTELAALKRARAANDTKDAGIVGTRTGTHRRVGVEV